MFVYFFRTCVPLVIPGLLFCTGVAIDAQAAGSGQEHDISLSTERPQVFIGRDPETGDEIMTVTPPPPQPQPQTSIPYIFPQVDVPYPQNSGTNPPAGPSSGNPGWNRPPGNQFPGQVRPENPGWKPPSGGAYPPGPSSGPGSPNYGRPPYPGNSSPGSVMPPHWNPPSGGAYPPGPSSRPGKPDYGRPPYPGNSSPGSMMPPHWNPPSGGSSGGGYFPPQDWRPQYPHKPGYPPHFNHFPPSGWLPPTSNPGGRPPWGAGQHPHSGQGGVFLYNHRNLRSY